MPPERVPPFHSFASPIPRAEREPPTWAPRTMHSPAPASPSPGVRYPLKLGRSVRNTASARSFVQLKFSHVGDAVDTLRPGVLHPSRTSCSVSLPTRSDASKSVSYACQRLRNVSETANYVLVFAADAFWLERVDDVFFSTRAGTAGAAIDVPDAGDDQFANEPESWMDVDDSGSPITADGNDAEEETVRPTAGKSTPQNITPRKMLTARTLQPMSEPLGSTAGKTVAMKGVAPDSRAALRADGSGGNLSEEEVVEEEDDASSSEDEASSDDTDSSDSADSDEYTDRSSDEED